MNTVEAVSFNRPALVGNPPSIEALAYPRFEPAPGNLNTATAGNIEAGNRGNGTLCKDFAGGNAMKQDASGGKPMFPTYRPVPGSLTWRLYRFFLENPDEELTRRDICNKFGVQAYSGIESWLQPAVAKGALRVRDGEDGRVWVLGTSPNVVIAELTAPEEEAPAAKSTAHDPFRQTMAIQVGAIPITRHPLSAMERAKAEMDEWLGRFDVGCTAVFSIHYLEYFQGPVKEYSQRTGAKFKLEPVDANRGGIERVS